jgi:hypothetical protein
LTVVLQHIPRDVTVVPPSEVILPPLVMDSSVMLVTGVVEIIGILVSSSFAQSEKREITKNDNGKRNAFFIFF